MFISVLTLQVHYSTSFTLCQDFFTNFQKFFVVFELYYYHLLFVLIIIYILIRTNKIHQQKPQHSYGSFMRIYREGYGSKAIRKTNTHKTAIRAPRLSGDIKV